MTTLFAQSISQGAVSGHAFTVNVNGDQVLFSKGNLQYIGNASTLYWKFADNQWDYLGSTGNNSSGDLFGWGTSGYNHGAICYQPWSRSQTSSDYYAYGNYWYNLFNQTGQADWGYNPISNGGNQPNQWRTLTIDEWLYVFNTRNTPSGIRYAKAQVNGVKGVILLPDDWSSSYYSLSSTNTSTAHYSSNNISALKWNSLEQHGAVFLPAAGERWGTAFGNIGSIGGYWSAACNDSDNAYYVSFNDGNINAGNRSDRSYGKSVRLVCSSENYSFGINATPNPAEDGTVSGGGAYLAGAECTLTATASAGYTFLNWTENGIVVSTDATYTFTVWGERDLVANFGGIITVTANPSEGGSVTVGNDNFFYDFENGWQGWTTFQGSTTSPNSWMHNTEYVAFAGQNQIIPECHNSSSGMMLSESYISASTSGGTAYGAVRPDNYLVSPQIRLGGSITFYAKAYNSSYYAEKFSVLVSELGNTSASDFTHTELTVTLSNDSWQEYSVDLSAYSGMGYVAIRHWDCRDQHLLFVDDVAIVEGHTSSDSGFIIGGETCVVTANPNLGYVFLNWTENGTEVSTDASYSFTVTGNRSLAANFEIIAQNNIVFADANVKALCVANWDINGDGELGDYEASLVTSLGNIFKNNTNIHSFNELQYFVSLDSIGEQTFYGCTELTQVTIPESVTFVGSKAFWNCPALQTVNYNAINCTSMQSSYNNNTYSVFSSNESGGAPALKRVVIGSGVQRIPDYAFKDGVDIYPGVTIRSSVTEIGAHAFENCSSITTLSFQNNSSLTTIGEYAFKDCSALNRALNLPNSVVTVGQYAFYGCSSIPSLTIGADMETIGAFAFWNCPGLATVNFNATNCTSMVTNSQYSVFNSGTSNGGATPIVTLSIGNNVTCIPDYAFRNSPNITHAITIPDVATYIGQYAFHGVQSSELTIGTDVASIGGYAFWNCPNLATVSFNATNCTTMVTNSQYSVFNSGTNDGEATPIVTLNFGENVTIIPDYAFRLSGNLANDLVIPNSVTNIGQYAFEGASGESRALLFGNSVNTIDQYAFQGCVGFTGDLVIPNSVTSIGQYAFNGCSGFNGTLTLPVNESITTINQYTFNGCSGLTGTLTIPASVTEVAYSAFRDCSGFTGALTLHNALATIGEYAFYGCSNIPELTIGEGVTSIGGFAFWNCPNLATVHFNAANCTSMVTISWYSVFSGTSYGDATPIVTLTIGENVTSIPAFAFRYSNNMTCDIHIPDAVTSIGTYAFANCSGNDVSIGNGVANINDYAFYQSAGFNGTLTLGNALANIGQNAFQGCSGFTGDLVIPNSITTLGEYAFEGCSGFDGSLVIGRGIQTINESTFANCSGFSGALILGTQVNSIGNNAFQNCSAFALVISENPNPIAATSSSFTAMNYSIPVYVPDGLVSNYQNATGWNNFTNYIEQFTFWDNLDNANWSDEMNWLSMELPTANDVVCITYNCDLDIDFDVLYVYVYNINDVLTIKSGQTLYTTYGVGLADPSQLVIETGGQVIIGDETNNATQTVALGTGFNWVSACVETNLDDLKAALLTALPNASSLKINSQSNGYTNYSGSRWRGTMNTWDASQMYIIEVPEACEITLTGAPIRPEDHPVSMAPGNNWIAFPLNTSMSVTDAFSGFPINGDKVSSQSNGFTNYTNRWRGTLGTLEPGKGYIYNNSTSTVNRSFIFPASPGKTAKDL